MGGSAVDAVSAAAGPSAGHSNNDVRFVFGLLFSLCNFLALSRREVACARDILGCHFFADPVPQFRACRKAARPRDRAMRRPTRSPEATAWPLAYISARLFWATA